MMNRLRSGLQGALAKLSGHQPTAPQRWANLGRAPGRGAGPGSQGAGALR